MVKPFLVLQIRFKNATKTQIFATNSKIFNIFTKITFQKCNKFIKIFKNATNLQHKNELIFTVTRAFFTIFS